MQIIELGQLTLETNVSCRVWLDSTSGFGVALLISPTPRTCADPVAEPSSSTCGMLTLELLLPQLNLHSSLSISWPSGTQQNSVSSASSSIALTGVFDSGHISNDIISMYCLIAQGQICKRRSLSSKCFLRSLKPVFKTSQEIQQLFAGYNAEHKRKIKVLNKKT